MKGRRSPRRAARNKVIEAVVMLAFFAVLVTVILPFAATALSDGFLEVMSNSPSP